MSGATAIASPFAALVHIASRGTAGRMPLPEGANPELPFKEPPQAPAAPAPRKARPKKPRAKYGPRDGSAVSLTLAYCQEPRTPAEILANVKGSSRTAISNIARRGLLVNLRGPRKTAVYVAAARADLYREAYANAPVPPRKAPPRGRLREVITWHSLTVRKPDMPDADITVLLHVKGASEPTWPGFWDGASWFYIDGSPVSDPVVAWADMPAGPGVQA